MLLSMCLFFVMLILSVVCDEYDVEFTHISRNLARHGKYRSPRSSIPSKNQSQEIVNHNLRQKRYNISSKPYNNLRDKMDFMSIPIPANYPCIIPNTSDPFGRYREYRIVITSTATYFPIFINWLYYYYRHCPITDYIYFVCLDRVIERRLAVFGLVCGHSHYLPAKGQYQRIWLIRGYVTRKLLQAGYDVILADSNAVWIGNPFLDLQLYSGGTGPPAATSKASSSFSSWIIGQHASFPESIYERIGATLCMGFVYFQSNTAIITLWEEIILIMSRSKTPDDQSAINHFMMQHGLTFARGSKLNYAKNLVADHGHFTYAGYRYNLTYLPHSRYRRLCNLQEGKRWKLNAVIAHCSTSMKELSFKQQAEENFNLWRLHGNWLQRLQGIEEQQDGSNNRKNSSDVSKGEYIGELLSLITSPALNATLPL